MPIRLLAALFVFVVASPALAQAGQALQGWQKRPWTVLLEGDFRMDFAQSDTESQLGRRVTSTRSEYRDFFGAVHLGLLKRTSKHLRIGGSIGYYGDGTYDVRPKRRDGWGTLRLGPTLLAAARLELPAFQIGDKIELFAGLRLGALVIVPGGALRDAIDENRQRGLSTWGTPRLGVLGGVDLGARFSLLEWLTLRASGGYAYQYAWLMRSFAESSAARAEEIWTFGVHRARVSLGVEASF